MVYLPHQAGARRRRWELKRKQTRAQTEKLRPVWRVEKGGGVSLFCLGEWGSGRRTAGGIQLRLPNKTGRFIFRQMLLSVVLRPMSHMMIGATKPTKNAQISGLYKAPSPKKRLGPTTPHKMLPLKCTRAIGHVKPLIASGVQMLGM